MSDQIYAREKEMIHLIPDRKAWGVDIPAYVYDLWMPLVGSDVIAFYGVLWRLARGGVTKGLSQKELAAACKKGNKTIARYAQILEDCGFIQTSIPNEKLRRLGFTTTYTVLDPPSFISEETIKKYAPDGDYEPLCPWLVEDNRCQPTPVLVSSDTLAKVSSDTLIDPSYLDPSIHTVQPAAQLSSVSRYQELRDGRIAQGIDPKGQTEYDEKADHQKLLTHPLCALIMEVTGSRDLTDPMLKKLSESFWGYHPGTRSQQELSGPLTLWDEDSYYRDWMRNVVAPMAKNHRFSRSKLVSYTRKGTDFLTWRNQRAPVSVPMGKDPRDDYIFMPAEDSYEKFLRTGEVT